MMGVGIKDDGGHRSLLSMVFVSSRAAVLKHFGESNSGDKSIFASSRAQSVWWRSQGNQAHGV